MISKRMRPELGVEVLETVSDWSHLSDPIARVLELEGNRLDELANAALVRIAARHQRNGEVALAGVENYQEQRRIANLFDIPNPYLPDMHFVRIRGEERSVNHYAEGLEEAAAMYDEWASTIQIDIDSLRQAL